MTKPTLNAPAQAARHNGSYPPEMLGRPKASPHDVEPDALLLTDPDPLLAFELRRDLWLQDHLDPLQMRGEPQLVGRLPPSLTAAWRFAASPVSISSNTKLCCSASSAGIEARAGRLGRAHANQAPGK